MGEVHLDTENLFRAFGWTPTREDAEDRAAQLRRYDADLRLESVDDVEAVAQLARIAVDALVDWSREWLRGHDDSDLGRCRSYGKKDPGVVVALVPLFAAGFTHLTVDWGKDKAEDAIINTVTRAGWAAAQYVFGCADKKLVGFAERHVSQVSEHQAVVVLTPDVFYRARRSWFGGQSPLYPTLRVYGEGHVAFHLLTQEWLRRQSAARQLRADPSRERVPVDRPAAPDAEQTASQWRERWFRRKFPKPSPQVPLSSSNWVHACRIGRISPLVSRRLRRQLEVLYADAYETGDGPVTWTLACRAAVMLDTVRAHLDGPPEGLTDIEVAAYAEARTRLLGRSPDRSEG